MRHIQRISAFLAQAVLLFASLRPLTADEGMWLFNRPPKEILRARHGFEINDPWLDHLQRASVRFMSGGSGSFVSEDGLVMSNHHVAADALQKLGTKDQDLLKDGFYARTLAEEMPCKDLELNVLYEVEDVTARVNAAVAADLAPEQAALARRAVMAQIEKESIDKTGLRSDVVMLYQGGAYHLYRYKRYTDVRLVFAPEQQTAFFGGDPDNFEYPRYCLDVAYFRAYENGQPAKVEHHLRWSDAGSKEGDLVFVSGHPGRTSRLLTVAELTYHRDRGLPAVLQRLSRAEVTLVAWSARSAENARRAKDDLFSVQNSRKAYVGGMGGLQDPTFFGRIVEGERSFREALGMSTEWNGARGAYERIAAAQEVIGQHAVRYRMFEQGWAFSNDLFVMARTLLRAGDERPKPNGERLREFRDSNRQSLEFALLSTKPIYDDYETLTLADSLGHLVSSLGGDDPLVRIVLAGKGPRARAAELVASTKLRDVAVRKQMLEGGAAAEQAAADPMIELARSIDTEARRLRSIMEAQDEIKQQAHAEIAKARFALQGAGRYPDATFTLRLAFGLVKGYREGGRAVPAFTDFAGMFSRSKEQNNQPPFDLPERWEKKGRRVPSDTPFNFVSTADIIGGNSGSPVVDRKGEVVGLIFDGNLQSLVLDYAFDDVEARALAVDSRAIVQALRRIYDARGLADELTGRRRPRS